VNAVLPAGTDEVITPYPPTPFQTLLFYCNDPVSMGRSDSGLFEKQPTTVLTGPQFSRVNIKVHRQLQAIRVDFLPGGLFRLLGIPMHQLFDGGFDATDFFGPGLKSLNGHLQQLSNLEEGKNRVEDFLLARLPLFQDRVPFDGAIQMMLKNNGMLSIEKSAALACLSLKQFERKCQERIGLSPKMFARIIRFSNAYRLHEAAPGMSWTKIAYEAGYFDQMHLIRDFKVFAGVNPSVIEQELLGTPLRMQKDIRY